MHIYKNNDQKCLDYSSKSLLDKFKKYYLSKKESKNLSLNKKLQIKKDILRKNSYKKFFPNRLIQTVSNYNINKLKIRYILKDILISEPKTFKLDFFSNKSLKKKKLTKLNSKIEKCHYNHTYLDEDDVIPFDASEYEKILVSTMERSSEKISKSNENLDSQNQIYVKETSNLNYDDENLWQSKNKLNCKLFSLTESELNNKEPQIKNDLKNFSVYNSGSIKDDLRYYYSLTDIKYCNFDDEEDNNITKKNNINSKFQKSSYSSSISSSSRSRSSSFNNSNEINSFNNNYYFENKKNLNKLQKSVTMPNANQINNYFIDDSNSIINSNIKRNKIYSSNIYLNAKNKTALKIGKYKTYSKKDNNSKQNRIRKLNELSKNKYLLLKASKKDIKESTNFSFFKTLDISNRDYLKKNRKFKNKLDNSDEADYDDNIDEDNFIFDESFSNEFNDSDYHYDYDYNCLITNTKNESENFKNNSCYKNSNESIFKRNSDIPKCFCNSVLINSTSAYDTCSNLSSNNISPNNSTNSAKSSYKSEIKESKDHSNFNNKIDLLNNQNDTKNKFNSFSDEILRFSKLIQPETYNKIPKLRIVDESSTTCTDISDPHWDGYMVFYIKLSD